MVNQRLAGKLEEIFQKLLSRYGKQHWWPAEELFEVMVGAILTQSTAWGNVEKAILNLKAAGVLSPESLRRLSHVEIAALIRPSGYYNVKARKLQFLVDWLSASCNYDLGLLFKRNTIILREELLSIYGIGEETADSILLYAGNKPVFVIDAYTRRIVDRLGMSPERKNYSDYQALFIENLSNDANLFNEFHALLVCLGKTVCRRRPFCEQCCLKDICGYFSGEPIHQVDR